MTKKVAIFISGSGSNMVSLVNSMCKQNYAWPSLVLSNKSCASGLTKAKNFDIPTVCIEPKKASGIDLDFEAEIQRELKNYKIELICLAGFMRVLSSNFVDCWKGKMLNIHPSLLPKYKGLNVHKRVLENGEKLTGCTVHEVTPELDCGRILGQATVPVLPHDTVESIRLRVLEKEHLLYPKVLQQFCLGRSDLVTM